MLIHDNENAVQSGATTATLLDWISRVATEVRTLGQSAIGDTGLYIQENSDITGYKIV